MCPVSSTCNCLDIKNHKTALWCSAFTSVFRQCFAETKHQKNCVPHQLLCFTSLRFVLKQNKLTCRFQIKLFVGLNPHATNKIEIPKEACRCIPLSNKTTSSGDELKQQLACHNVFPQKHAHAGQKQKGCLLFGWFPCKR